MDGSRPYVEYCLANVSARRRATLDAADVPTRGVCCLDRCGRCFRSAFLVVDGEPVEGAACDRFIDAHTIGDPE
ncbi:DUF1450 domain-containing protein [Salinarchaeum chitinilyticum]